MKSSECEGWTRMNRQIRKMLDEQSRWLRIYQFLEENPFVLPMKGSVIKDALIDEDFLHVLTEDELIIFDINVYQ